MEDARQVVDYGYVMIDHGPLLAWENCVSAGNPA
jgi:hypothetical protein